MMGLLIQLVFLAVGVAIGWKIFVKAGKPGWAVIVPIYNIIVYLEIIGKPWWWMFLFFIPLVNLIVAILCLIAFAKSFGKGVGFAIGLIIPVVGIVLAAMLAFGDDKYLGPGGPAGAGVPATT